MMEEDKPNPGNMVKSKATDEASMKVLGRESTLLLDRYDTFPTEILYVTSINKTDKTLFGQLCKFSEEELIDFNTRINNYCMDIEKDRENGNPEKALPTKIHRGDIFCAKCSHDSRYYRALVRWHDKDRKRTQVMFIDYGNLVTVDSDKLVKVSAEDVPIMKRTPFGITCSVAKPGKPEESDFLLSCSFNKYLMVDGIERTDKIIWKVEIAKHAYNMPFWNIFRPQIAAIRRSRYRKIDRPNLMTGLLSDSSDDDDEDDVGPDYRADNHGHSTTVNNVPKSEDSAGQGNASANITCHDTESGVEMD